MAPMGTERRRLTDRLAHRKHLKPAEQPTLVRCPACLGQGLVHREETGTRYRFPRCSWCQGAGLVDAVMVEVFARWVSIKASNGGRRCGRGHELRGEPMQP